MPADLQQVLPLFSNPAVEAEFRRCSQIVGLNDPYKSSDTYGIHDVLKAHFMIIDFAVSEGVGIGGYGPKDPNLLHSALQRQHVGYGGQRKWKTKFELCATMMYGLIMNHPFHDANKRTAFLSALAYLDAHGRTPTVSHQEFEDFTVDVADHGLRKYARYVELAKAGDDPDVRFIAYYIKSRTRDVDHRSYTVTFRELRAILNRFGYDLGNPSGNFIDVVKQVRRWHLIGGASIEEVRICQVGFPGWTRQVSRAAIKTIRQRTHLVPEKGVDARTFFQGVDDLHTLIAHYEEPLRRLADR